MKHQFEQDHNFTLSELTLCQMKEIDGELGIIGDGWFIKYSDPLCRRLVSSFYFEFLRVLESGTKEERRSVRGVWLQYMEISYAAGDRFRDALARIKELEQQVSELKGPE